MSVVSALINSDLALAIRRGFLGDIALNKRKIFKRNVFRRSDLFNRLRCRIDELRLDERKTGCQLRQGARRAARL